MFWISVCGEVIKTCLSRHGLALQELLKQEERLLRTVQGNLMAGATDGYVGQAFILHTPATNLYFISQACILAMEEKKTVYIAVRN